MSDRNVELTRDLYAAFSQRDRETLFGLLAPDFVADMSRSVGPERGVYESPSRFSQLVETYWDAMETFEIVPKVLRTGGGKAVRWTVYQNLTDATAVTQGE